MTTDAPQHFEDVLAALAREGVRAVVVGGVAVVLHGHARPIEDLDLVVGTDPFAARHAMQVLAMAGFVASVPLPLASVTVLRLFDAQMREIDVFARYPVPYAELDRDAVAARVGSVSVRIASLPHLIAAKRMFGRPHDLADVKHLERLSAGTSP
jgi:hypothetical protein